MIPLACSVLFFSRYPSPAAWRRLFCFHHGLGQGAERAQFPGRERWDVSSPLFRFLFFPYDVYSFSSVAALSLYFLFAF